MSRSIVFPEVTSLMLLNYGSVYLRDREPVFSKMLRTHGMSFSFELPLVFNHVQSVLGAPTAGFCFFHLTFISPSSLAITLFFQHVTLIDHPFLICWIFPGRGWGVLKECPLLRYLWWF